nr:hypothetical protein CFP56_22449 [Quercus suber]
MEQGLRAAAATVPSHPGSVVLGDRCASANAMPSASGLGPWSLPECDHSQLLSDVVWDLRGRGLADSAHCSARLGRPLLRTLLLLHYHWACPRQGRIGQFSLAHPPHLSSTLPLCAMPVPPGFCASCYLYPLLFSNTDRWEADSWVEISSQPSSSSLSSATDEANPTSLKADNDPRRRRRRALPPSLLLGERGQEGTSSQEEYDESESESDRVMTSSGEGLPDKYPPSGSSMPSFPPDDDDDEDRTAINYPLHNSRHFTPQPNAFTHPPSNTRHASQPVPGSYFPAATRPAFRQSSTAQSDAPRSSHLPRNILSPSYHAAAQHEEALRASLNTLLSCAAAARGLSKQDPKRTQATNPEPPRSNRVEPTALRLIPGPAPPTTSTAQHQRHHLQEPTFQPTLRRISTSTTVSSSSTSALKEKRKAVPATRSSSRERRTTKKARRTTLSSPVDDLTISPTLLTWIVSAGVVVFLSALSFTAGYSVGREAGRLEGAGDLTAVGDEQLRNCAREAGRSGLGLKRSLARSAVQV